MPPEATQRGLSTSQRLAIRQYARAHPRLTQLQLKEWFECSFQRLITQPTISESLSSKFAYLNTDILINPEQQRQRPPKHPHLKTALFKWHQRVEIDIPLSSEAIKEQPRRF